MQTPQLSYNPANYAGVVMVATVSIEDAKRVAAWGTNGIDGDKPLSWVRLRECDTEHLNNILNNVKHLGDDYREIILSLLQDREVSKAQFKVNQIVMYIPRNKATGIETECTPVQVRSIGGEDERDYKGRLMYYVQPSGGSGLSAVAEQLRPLTPEEKGE